MLTRADLGKVRYLIVGTHADGTRTVLDEFKSRPKAERRARRYRQMVEGFERIDVERIGRVKVVFRE